MSRGAASSPWIAKFEGISFHGMALGVAVMLQPWWEGGMRAGFFVAAVCTVAQIALSHWPSNRTGRAA